MQSADVAQASWAVAGDFLAGVFGFGPAESNSTARTASASDRSGMRRAYCV
jgi:hypothetical protein